MALTTLSSCASTPKEPIVASEWKLCGDIECTTLTVPNNWAEPNKEQLQLHVVRHRAQAGTSRIGTLVVNPGGPNLSGSTMLRSAQEFLSDDLIRRFDIVSWDPRGTGLSTPTFACPTFDVLGILNYNDSLKRQKQRVKECTEKNPLLVPHMSTADSARDLHAIQLALNEDKLSFLGFSYGSLLGATWSGMYPTSVRALVLDAPPSPRMSWPQRIDDFSERVQKLWGEFTKKYSPDTGNIDRTTLARAYVAALPTRALWPTLAVAIGAKDLRALTAFWSDYQYQTEDLLTNKNIVGARYATECSDQPTPRSTLSPSTTQQTTSDIARVVTNDSICALWTHSQPLPSFKNSSATALVIGATNDVITPLNGAVALVHELPRSQLLTVESSSHTNYLTNTCTTKAVDEFLISQRLPNRSVCS